VGADAPPPGATQRRRRDGRPVEAVPPAASTAPPPPAIGLGAAGLTAAVLGPAVAGQVAAGATLVDVAGLPSAQALSLAAASILQGFERFMDGRALVTEADVVELVEDEYGDAIPEDVRLELVGREVDYDRHFRAKARARLDRDLPSILAITDRAVREAELRKVLDRERRYAEQREEAIALRSLGAAEARVLEATSPQGALWTLGPTQTHTADCLAMAGKVWPWTVLRGFHPPLHHGCACSLQPAAVAERALGRAPVMPSPELAFAAMAVQEARWEPTSDLYVDPDDVDGELEPDDPMAVLEAYAKRWAKGTTHGGQFRPKRGGNPGRPVGGRMRHLARRRIDLIDLPHEAPRPARDDAPAKIGRKRGREMQVGDEVLAGGEWHRVEGIDPKMPGYVTLEGFGPALLDPDTHFEVRGTHAPGGDRVTRKGADVKVGDTLHLKEHDEDGMVVLDSSGAPVTRPWVVLEARRDDAVGAMQVVVKDPDYGRRRRTLSLDENFDVTPGTDATPDAGPLPGLDADVQAAGFRDADEARRELAMLRDLPETWRDRPYVELLGLRDTFQRQLRRAMENAGVKPGTLEPGKSTGHEQVEKWRGQIARISEVIDARKAAAVFQRQRQAKAHAAETGKLLISGDERRELLSKRRDVYADAGLLGPKLPKPGYTPELFRTSDLSGQGVRYYVELPDGRIAHPDELHDALERGRIVVAEDLPRPEGEKPFRSDLLPADARKALTPTTGKLPEPDVGGEHAEQRAAIAKWRGRLSADTAAQITKIAQREAFSQDNPKVIRDEWARLQADAMEIGAGDRGGLEAPYSRGGRHGLPRLPEPLSEDAYELRFRDDAALVMWDRRANKPYAVWDRDWDMAAVQHALDEQNTAARIRSDEANAPPANVPLADVEKHLLNRTIGQMGDDPVAEIMPGFGYLGKQEKVSYKREVRDGTLMLPDGFFRQGRDRREPIVFEHLGKRLYGAMGDDDVAAWQEHGAPDVSKTYAALNSSKLRDRLEAIEPDRAAFIGELARKHGLPMTPEAERWLSERGVELEPDTHVGATGVDAAPDPPELVDAKALAEQFNRDESMRNRWHFIVPEKGFGMAAELWQDVPTGRTNAGYVYRNADTGIELEFPKDTAQPVVARLNRGDSLDRALEDRLAGRGTDVLTELGGEGWDHTSVASHARTNGTWHRLVHPDGRGFEVFEGANGFLQTSRQADGFGGARSFTPHPNAVEDARATALRTNPVEFVSAGDDLIDVEKALRRGGWTLDMTGDSSHFDVTPVGSDVATRFEGRLSPGAQRWTTYRRGGEQIVLHWKQAPGTSPQAVPEKGSQVVAVGWSAQGGFGNPSAIAPRDRHDMLARRAREARDAAAAAAQGEGTGKLHGWLASDAAQRTGRKVPKVPKDAVDELTAGKNVNQVVRSLQGSGWEVYKSGRRWNRTERSFTLTYKLRGKHGTPVEGASLTVKGPGLAAPGAGPITVDASPNPQGRGDDARKRLEPGKVWADRQELYRDSLGRADELAERYGAVSFVTAIRDESAGRRAMAHHEWNGTIVMGTGTGFTKRFDAFLEKYHDPDVTLTDGDHHDFYDALSTLQHEVNHGVGAAGPHEGGLAFGSRHYRKDSLGLSATGTMEEALTEETARLLTVDWLRAQGMTDTLEAVKRMSKRDSRYQGSYQDYRRRLARVFDAAGIDSPDERRELVMRMKFQMTPEERGSFLDDRIRERVRALPEDERREWPSAFSSGAIDRPSSAGGVSPTSLLMRSKQESTLRKPLPSFVPVVDDPLDDVDEGANPGLMAQIGDEVAYTSADGTPKLGTVTGSQDRNYDAGELRTLFVDVGGEKVEVGRWQVNNNLSRGRTRVGSAARIGAGDGKYVSVYGGEPVWVQSGWQGGDDGRVFGIVVEVMDGGNVKVRTQDGLELWYDPARVTLSLPEGVGG
jgi:hypothetical protein